MKTPQLPEEKVRELLKGLVPEHPCAILAVRGYYTKTMGNPESNDAGIYDDAAFFVHGGGMIATQWNTDPSRLGWNPGVGKNFAMLCPGDWFFIRGPHKGKTPALRQATEEEADKFGIPNHGHFKVFRAKNMADVLKGTARIEEGYYAINCHRGGDATTSSWGCQTEPADDYPRFLREVWNRTTAAKMKRIPYRLIDGPVN